MRKQILIPCIIVLAACLLFLLRTPRHQEANIQPQNKPAVSQLENQQAQPRIIPSQQNSNAASVGKIPTPPSNRPTLEEIQQRILVDWQRPIGFYGKIVDENSNAVGGAHVSFHWMETPYENGSRSLDTESDTNGLFLLQNAKGPTLSVTIGKKGYYTSRSTPDGFRYDGDNPFQVNWSEPVVYCLRKKGEGVELLTSEKGMRPDVWVRIPKDSTPVRVDFFQKQASANGQLVISQIKPPFQGATNWSFTLSIPDGGLVENQDEFQFEAPESGYQPTVEYNFSKSETNWTTQVSKQFYIAFGAPRKYGWLRIESNLTQETVFLTYAINPDGSRNLEPTH